MPPPRPAACVSLAVPNSSQALWEKKIRKEKRQELIEVEGRLFLIELLQEACFTMPERTVHVGGEQIPIDIRWNFGLESQPQVRAPPPSNACARALRVAAPRICQHAAPKRVADEDETATRVEPPSPRQLAKYCYFCASLSPPIRVQHTFVVRHQTTPRMRTCVLERSIDRADRSLGALQSCPKRRKANVREYTPEALAHAIVEIEAQRKISEDKMNQYHIANEQASARRSCAAIG